VPVFCVNSLSIYWTTGCPREFHGNVWEQSLTTEDNISNCALYYTLSAIHCIFPLNRKWKSTDPACIHYCNDTSLNSVNTEINRKGYSYFFHTVLSSQFFNGSCSPSVRPLATFLFFMAHSYFSTRENLRCQHWWNAAKTATKAITRAILQQHSFKTWSELRSFKWTWPYKSERHHKAPSTQRFLAAALTNTYAHTHLKKHI